MESLEPIVIVSWTRPEECNGDLKFAEQAYDLPYAALVKRGKKLLKEGKLTEIIV